MDTHLENVRAEIERKARQLGRTLPPLRQTTLSPAEQSKASYLDHLNSDLKFALSEAGKVAARVATHSGIWARRPQQVALCAMTAFEGKPRYAAAMQRAAEVVTSLLEAQPSCNALEAVADASQLVRFGDAVAAFPGTSWGRLPIVARLAERYGATLTAWVLDPWPSPDPENFWLSREEVSIEECVAKGRKAELALCWRAAREADPFGGHWLQPIAPERPKSRARGRTPNSRNQDRPAL